MRSWRSSFVAALVLALTVSSAYALDLGPQVLVAKSDMSFVVSTLPELKKLTEMIRHRDGDAWAKKAEILHDRGEFDFLDKGMEVFKVREIEGGFLEVRRRGATETGFCLKSAVEPKGR